MNPNPSSQCLRAWSPQRSRLKTAPTNWRHRAPNLPATNRAKPDTRHRWMLINMPIQRTIPLRSTSCHLPSTDPFDVVRPDRHERTTTNGSVDGRWHDVDRSGIVRCIGMLISIQRCLVSGFARFVAGRFGALCRQFVGAVLRRDRCGDQARRHWLDGLGFIGRAQPQWGGHPRFDVLYDLLIEVIDCVEERVDEAATPKSALGAGGEGLCHPEG